MTSTPGSSPHTDENLTPEESHGDDRDGRPDLDADAAGEEAAQPGVDPDWSQTTQGSTSEEGR